MAVGEFDISFYKAAFGSQSFEVPPVAKDNGQWKQVNGQWVVAQSALGSPYYRQDNGRWYFMPVRLGGVDLGLPIVGIAARNHWEETPMVEHKGSVKELITMEDVVILVRGIIKRADETYPDTEIMALRDLREQKRSLSLECPLTDIFLNSPEGDGYDNVVIHSLVIPPKSGFQGSVPYELELVSDQEFTLEEEE